jgi:hypothetical protein
MTARFIDQIDWRRPWLSVLQPTAAPILRAADWRHAANAAAASQDLRNHRGLPLRFVAQSDLPAGTAYEAFISSTGNVPTRDNLHDFFNALMWLAFPAIKTQLNALQAMELDKSATAIRGKLRDGATIFDENAALLVTSDRGLVTALRNHEWREVFITRRAMFGPECEVCLFGHALLEKLVSPYKAITAHTWILIEDHAFFNMRPADRRTWLDVTIATQLAAGLSTSDFTPLPVLGVPGWWDSQDNAFYEDAAVFRQKRRVSI